MTRKSVDAILTQGFIENGSQPHSFCPACRGFRDSVFVEGEALVCERCAKGPADKRVTIEDAALRAWPAADRSEASRGLLTAQALLTGPFECEDGWQSVTGSKLDEVRRALFVAAADIVSGRQSLHARGASKASSGCSHGDVGPLSAGVARSDTPPPPRREGK